MDLIKTTLLNGALLFVPLLSYAQNNHLPDVSEEVSKFAASESNNTAFLTELPLKRSSYMQFSATKGDGKFINFNQSDNMYRIGLKTESYYRFNDRIMLYGMVSYGMDRGKNMTGSAFVPNDNLPFDLIESTDTCEGSKRLEAYTLSGAIGYQATKRLSLGANVFYKASNYAKFKDLRHQNSLMEFKAGAGAAYYITDWLKAGASYAYDRRNEAVAFDFYGNTDNQYYTIISYGAFFGRIEAFGESGYTAESTPLFTESHTGALQIEINPGTNIKWFNDISYKTSDGRFGTGDDREVVFSTHEGNNLRFTSKISLQNKKNIHVAGLSFDKNNTENFENSYRESTDANGVSHIEYFGKNKVFDGDRFNSSAYYTFFKDGAQARALYFVGAAARYASAKKKSILYPFYRKQTVNMWSAAVHGAYNWFKSKQVFTLSAQLGYGAGSGTMKKDGLYTSMPDDAKKPVTFDKLLVKEYDYLTAARIFGTINFGYERLILKNISGYAVAGVSPRYALNKSLKNESFVDFEIKIGAKF